MGAMKVIASARTCTMRRISCPPMDRLYTEKKKTGVKQSKVSKSGRFHCVALAGHSLEGCKAVSVVHQRNAKYDSEMNAMAELSGVERDDSRLCPLCCSSSTSSMESTEAASWMLALSFTLRSVSVSVNDVVRHSFIWATSHPTHTLLWIRPGALYSKRLL